MSVDVFGRTLKKIEVTRGPRGIGYKLTENGHFDAEGKRLCNLSVPLEPNDSVDLQTLKNLIGSEVKSLYDITKRLQSDVDDLNTLLNSYKSEIKDAVQKKVAELTLVVEDHATVLEDLRESGWIKHQ